MNKNLVKISDLLTRIVVGVIFTVAGASKLFGGIDGFAGWLGNLGVPLPLIFAYIVCIVELIGGLMLLIGVWTHVSASLLAFIMLVAILLVHLGEGWAGIRYPLLLFVVLIRYIGTPGYCNAFSCLKR